MSRREKAMKRRQQVMRQKAALAVLTICIVFCGVLLGSNISASGKSHASLEHGDFKYYTSIRVERGDSLWSIAGVHMGPEYEDIQEYIAEVKSLNQLTEDDIHAGQYLLVPYYSNDFR